ncbi:MAG: Hpt domain-containing protein, partial [Thiobacillus sp.]|nr:Hpt domain-containing protein [Thiobacillus sp.]
LESIERIDDTPHLEIDAAAVDADVEDLEISPLEMGQAEAIPATAQPIPAAEEAPSPTDVEGVQTLIPEGVEEELLEIFLEEANEVLAAISDAGVLCQSNPDDPESLTVIRRGFHTLKGSGRMVGLIELGDVAWRLEQLMNSWLGEKKPANSDLMDVIGHARDLFQDWVDALQAGQSVALPVPALLAAVERVDQGQPPDFVSGQAAAQAAPSQADEHVAELAQLDESSSTEPDFETASEPLPAVISAFERVEDPETELSLNESTAEALAEFETVDISDIEDVDPGLDVGALIEYAIAPEAPDFPDEVCIGSVCLSNNLYEIFMVEAHQRLAVLQEESERHAEAANSMVSEHARRAIHTLGGIAGTAGITNLADLSHAFEQYWNRFVHAPMPAAHLPLVDDTIARLHEMITTIESGQLPESASDLIATLGELEDEQITPAAEPVADVFEPEVTIVEAIQDTDESALVGSASPAVSAEHSSAEAERDVFDVSTLVSAIKASAPTPVFERRDVADEIDEQLLPIFIEEAETLVPDTGAQLRAWKVAPGDIPARDALQRNLHTIKGSARMVGAMRLGELTHVMESRVIAVIEGHLSASPEVFDTLEAQLDRLADTVDRLKQGDFTPLAEDVSTPVASPVEPTLSLFEEAELLRTPIARQLEAPSQVATRDNAALTLRVRADWVDRMVNQAGEVAISRSRIESEVFAFKRHVNELSEALVRLRGHIREVEIQAESQMQATFQTQGVAEQFDPLEFDRFT